MRLAEKFERNRVNLPAEVFSQRLRENGGLRIRVRKQRHRRAELEVVWIAENLFDGPILDLNHQACTFLKARPEDRMAPIGRGFFKRADSVEVGSENWNRVPSSAER